MYEEMTDAEKAQQKLTTGSLTKISSYKDEKGKVKEYTDKKVLSFVENKK
jgi:hypothetical protein